MSEIFTEKKGELKREFWKENWNKNREEHIINTRVIKEGGVGGGRVK